MAKIKTKFCCTQCGYESPKWSGKCVGCQGWNTMVEQMDRPIKVHQFQSSLLPTDVDVPVSIVDIHSDEQSRVDTGSSELNRVLGGGIVIGSLMLVGGDPGIGKSTLLLQTSHVLAHSGVRVLYVSGEESTRQTKLRADRLGALSEKLYVLSETNIDRVEEAIQRVQPSFLVMDSIQTVYVPEITSAPGSVAQVRECTARFMRIAKGQGIATVLVGHVTKEGAIAGPKLLEHMVDCVLYFEGDRHHVYRLLRVVKNRFGSTNEIGIFEMSEDGLREVSNPSKLFLSERPAGVSGSTVVASMEGTRPLLVELQALVASTHFPSPRRIATGIDYHRMNLIIAVLEKRMGMFFQNQDAYINVAGGVKLDEPAVDLAIALSLASSLRDLPTKSDDIVFGEVGLTGEVRAVSKAEQRVKEAQKLGFRRVILPEKSLKGWKHPCDIEIIGVNTVEDALSVAFN